MVTVVPRIVAVLVKLTPVAVATEFPMPRLAPPFCVAVQAYAVVVVGHTNVKNVPVANVPPATE
jgi:hypothetical protein